MRNWKTTLNITTQLILFTFLGRTNSRVSRQLDAENWTRDNWSPQPGRATIGRMRQLDACDNWTVDACGML
jgi:hypothetical protein